jgi:hypothetical protein
MQWADPGKNFSCHIRSIINLRYRILSQADWKDADLSRNTHCSLIVLTLLIVAGSAVAQEDDGVAGTWGAVIVGSGAQGRCGQPLSLIELEVGGKDPDAEKPTYDVLVTAWISSQRCPTIRKETGKARMVVRGTRVSLSYDKEEWGAEMLVRDGNNMAGINAVGADVEWVRATDLPISLQTGMVRQNLITNMTAERLEELKNEVVASGQTAEDATELAPKLVDGFAGCVVDVAQFQSAVQRLPYDEVLKIFDPISEDQPNSRIVRRLDRTATEMRTRVCFYEVSVGLGVKIM